jgi:hypothetical protein
MPQFWQIDSTQWLNPAHIVYVEDNLDRTPRTLHVTMVAVTSGRERSSLEPYTLTLGGGAREKLLAYLARETESAPPQTST